MFTAHQRDVLILYRVHILAWAGRPFFSNSFPSCGIFFFLCLPFSGRVSWLATSWTRILYRNLFHCSRNDQIPVSLPLQSHRFLALNHTFTMPVQHTVPLVELGIGRVEVCSWSGGREILCTNYPFDSGLWCKPNISPCGRRGWRRQGSILVRWLRHCIEGGHFWI